MTAPGARALVNRLVMWWEGADLRTRVRVAGLIAATIGAVAHQSVLWNWFVEDAAISFSYARNLAHGDGLVTTIGGERVEGYSNPTWVALLALFNLFGLSPFDAARGLQVVLAAATVPLTWAVAREASPGHDDEGPLLAVLFLAGGSQFAIWGACGLENALFSFLLAAAVWRMLVELRTQGTPWSALLWLALALTRPEAVVYAGIGGAATAVFTLADRRGVRPTLTWAALFTLPFGLYHAARFAYFAYELPQTYYAKIGEHKPAQPLTWDGHGWRYVRNFSSALGQGLLLPVYAVGMAGTGGARAMIAIAMSAACAVAVLLPGDQRLLLPVVLGFTFLCYQALIRSGDQPPRPWLTAAGLVLVGAFVAAAEAMRAQGSTARVWHPEWMADAPPYLLLGLAAIAPILAWRDPGSRGRVVCWALLIAVVGFAIGVSGDWMAGWRWMSLASVPAAVLLGRGAAAIAGLAQHAVSDRATWGAPAWVAGLALAFAPLPASIAHTQTFAENPVTGPYSVKQRVTFKEKTLARIHHWGPVNDLDVDMGAHMYWTDYRMMDIAGLVDVPFAQHRFARPFLIEYIFEERRPELVHLHGGWASNSRIPTIPEWRAQYFEIPGFPVGRSIHNGNYVRRDLLLRTDLDPTPERRVAFERGVVLEGWSVPTPEVAPGHGLFLEVRVRSSVRLAPEDDFRILAFLAESQGERVVTWDLAPGYDWLRPHDWRRNDVFVGRFSPLLPADLPEGSYALGFVIVGGDQAVWPALALRTHPDDGPPSTAQLGGTDGWPARVAVGEARFADAVRVVSADADRELVAADLGGAIAAAGGGDCAAAEARWFAARSRRARSATWAAQEGPAVKRAIARCWAASAATSDDPVAALTRARDFDPVDPEVWAEAAPVADRRYADGMTAMGEQDWEAAYAAFSDVLAVRPDRAWARRYAEQARSMRLGIDRIARDAAAEEHERLRDEMRARRAREANE